MDDDQKEQEERFDFNQPDPAIAMLAKVANRGIGMSVTLLVQGLVISGVTTSGRTYFERVKEEFNGLVPQGAEGSMDPIWDGMAERYPAEGEEPTEEQRNQTTAFIHLVDARTSPEGLRFSTWRGRLSDVSGWTIGQFSGN